MSDAMKIDLAPPHNPDRNERVRALRALSVQPSDDAAAALVQALSDSERRVRDVAVQSCRRFTERVEIVERLVRIALDEDEKRKIRGRALAVLGGVDGPPIRFLLPQAAADALRELVQHQYLRSTILRGLCQLELATDASDPAALLLREFAAHGSAAEAAVAQRALNGEKLVNLGLFDEPMRTQIAQSCDLAAGRVFYWINRNSTFDRAATERAF